MGKVPPRKISGARLVVTVLPCPPQPVLGVSPFQQLSS